LQQHGSEAARTQYRESQQRRQDFRALTAGYRERLQKLYAGAGSDEARRSAKADLLAQLRADHARMKQQQWGGFAGYDPWFANVNNAALGVLAAYTDLAGDFERLFAQQGNDFERFYARVAEIAALPKAERHATLRAIP
jgi:predicted aminopeptidase